MRSFILFLFVLLGSQHLSAARIDPGVLKNITGSKWELTEEKKAGKLFSKANKNPIQQQITFTTGSLLFDGGDQHYECTYLLKNKKEFWLTCAEPDQYIYRIHALSTNVLVMDMLVKGKDGKYIKKKRLTYNRKK